MDYITPSVSVELSIPSLSVNIEDVVIVGTQAEPYQGDYEVTPTVEGFVMYTDNKLMEDDVTVKPIPYKSTTNPQGGNTVYIGSSLDE